MLAITAIIYGGRTRQRSASSLNYKGRELVSGKAATVTSRLFTHIVSTEKMRNDLRDRKDPRVTKYTYYNSCF